MPRHFTSIAEETRREKLIKRTETLKRENKKKKQIKTTKEKKEDKKKKKQIKKMGKVVKKRQEKSIKKRRGIVKSKSRSKVVPKEISRTKSIIKRQPSASRNVDILKEELKKLREIKNRILKRDTIEEDGRSIIPSSSANSIRIIDIKIRNNIAEQNELIDRFEL